MTRERKLVRDKKVKEEIRVILICVVRVTPDWYRLVSPCQEGGKTINGLDIVTPESSVIEKKIKKVIERLKIKMYWLTCNRKIIRTISGQYDSNGTS